MKFRHFTLLALLFCSQVYADNVIWSGHKGNPGHSGYINVKTNPAKFKVLWTKSDWVHSGYFSANSDSTATDHLLYFTAETNTPVGTDIYAVDPVTGKTVWQTELPGNTAISGPLYVDGKVLAIETTAIDASTVNAVTNVVALDGNTGTVLYNLPINLMYYATSATPVISGNDMYASDDLAVINIDTNTGLINWTVFSGNRLGLGAPIQTSASTNYVFHPGNDGIAVISHLGVKTYIQAPNHNGFPGLPVQVIIDEQSKTLYATYMLTGDPRSEKLIAYDVDTLQPKWNLIDTNENNIVAANDSLYYTDQNQDRVTEANAATGKTIWTWQAESHASKIIDMLATPDILFVSIYDPSQPQIIAFSRKTHNFLWKINKAAYLSADDNRLYLNDRKSLTAISLN